MDGSLCLIMMCIRGIDVFLQGVQVADGVVFGPRLL